VAEVVVALWLNVMVLTVLLAGEMSLISQVRHVVLQVPVPLLEVSIRVVLVAMHKLSHVWGFVSVSVLIWGLLMVDTILSGVVGSVVLLGGFFASLLSWGGLGLLLLLLLLLLLVVHFFVEEGGFGAHVLLSLSLGLRWLLMMVWVMMVRIRIVVVGGWLMRVHICGVWVLVGVSWVRGVWVVPGVGVHVGWLVDGTGCVWVERIVRGGIRIGAVSWLIPIPEWLLVVNLALHVAIVLLSTNIVVLVGLLWLLAFLDHVLWSWLSSDSLNTGRLEGVDAVTRLMGVWLHLEHQVTVLNVGLGCAESCAVGVESGVVRLVPSASIEGVEGVSPVEIESLCLVVVSIGLDIVIHGIPWHVLGIKSLSPRFESWSPEVHHDRLRLGCELHGWVVLGDTTNFLIINGISDEVWGPCHLVDVPVILWVKARHVVVRLTLCLTITVDYIHAEWVLLHRWYNLHIELVPAAWVEVWAIPVGEERADCTLLIWGLHAGDEFTVSELLKAGDGARSVLVGFSHSKGCNESNRKFHLIDVDSSIIYYYNLEISLRPNFSKIDGQI